MPEWTAVNTLNRSPRDRHMSRQYGKQKRNYQHSPPYLENAQKPLDFGNGPEPGPKRMKQSHDVEAEDFVCISSDNDTQREKRSVFRSIRPTISASSSSSAVGKGPRRDDAARRQQINSVHEYRSVQQQVKPPRHRPGRQSSTAQGTQRLSHLFARRMSPSTPFNADGSVPTILLDDDEHPNLGTTVNTYKGTADPSRSKRSRQHAQPLGISPFFPLKPAKRRHSFEAGIPEVPTSSNAPDHTLVQHRESTGRSPREHRRAVSDGGHSNRDSVVLDGTPRPSQPCRPNSPLPEMEIIQGNAQTDDVLEVVERPKPKANAVSRRSLSPSTPESVSRRGDIPPSKLKSRGRDLLAIAHGKTKLSSSNEKFAVKQLAKERVLVYDEKSSGTKSAYLYIHRFRTLRFCFEDPSAPEDEHDLFDLIRVMRTYADKGKSAYVIITLRPQQPVWIEFDGVDGCTRFLDALENCQFKFPWTKKEEKWLLSWWNCQPSSSMLGAFHLFEEVGNSKGKRAIDHVLVEVTGKRARQRTESTREDDLVPSVPSGVEELPNSFRRPLTLRETRSSTRAGAVPRDGLTDKRGTSPLRSLRTGSLEFSNTRSVAPGRTLSFDAASLEACEFPVVYPANGPRKASVDQADLIRLDDGQFLNDNLISFYLRYLEHQRELSDQDGSSRIYFFNTFFYEKLVRRRRREINYDAVSKWTSKIDLFTYDFVVVPINESAHWYLAVICNLKNLIGTDAPAEDVDLPRDVEQGQNIESVAAVDLSDSRPVTPHPGDANSVGYEAGESIVIPPTPSPTRTTHECARMGYVEECGADDAQGDREDDNCAKVGKVDEELHTPKAPPTRGKRVGRGRRYSVNSPTIITLDSLAGSHSETIRNLKEYVVMEAKNKKDVELQIGDISGMTAKGIPMQNNYCDCGLYLLGYMDKFLQNPRQLVNQLLQREPLQDEDWPNMKPRDMRESIRRLLIRLSKEQFRASKEAKKEAAKRSGKYHAKAASATGDATSPARTAASDGGATAAESVWTDTSSDVGIVEETPRPASAKSRRAEPPSSPRPTSVSSLRAEPLSPSSPGRRDSPGPQRANRGRMSDDLEEMPAGDAAELGDQAGNESIIVIDSGPS